MDIELDFSTTEQLDLWEKDRLLRIGQFIKTEREAQHLTHEALSEKAGGTPAGGTISRIERGQTNAKRDTLLKLLNALGHLPETLDKLSQHTMIPGTVAFQGMIRVLYGIHVDKSIPTKVLNERGVPGNTLLRAWVKEHWNDPVFNKLPLGSAGSDMIWQLLEEHRYVQATDSGDYIYATPSEDEMLKMGMLFQGSIVMLISLLFDNSNDDDRRQSGAALQMIAKRFDQCAMSPELAKLTIKQYFLYLAKGVPSYASVMMQFLFLLDHAIDKEAYKAFGGSPGSEEVGRGLILYQARIKCIHFTLMQYGHLVANPEYVDDLQEKLAEINAMHEEYVRLVSQPGRLRDVLRDLQPPYRPNFLIQISDDGSGAPLLERARELVPVLQSIPDEHLVVSTIDTLKRAESAGIFTDTSDDISTSTTFGMEIDPLFGFQIDSISPSASLNETHVDYGLATTDTTENTGEQSDSADRESDS